jgi:hypothetical protein
MFAENDLIITINELEANYTELKAKKVLLNNYINSTLEKANKANSPTESDKTDFRSKDAYRNSINKVFSDLVMAASTVDTNMINIKKSIMNIQYKVYELKQKNKEVDEGLMKELVNRTLSEIMSNKDMIAELIQE